MYFKHFIVFGISHKNLDLCQRENFIQNDPTSVVERLFQLLTTTIY